ncbi:hypothetical protein BCR44DRAFT_32754 [Catenaria anguillulae PL171]|uniref:Uncharacterized protein n=1 Tax=Catenaria anguillulae PL171 TaxID=765915 RepID=A0A1Y2HRP9_9FUNG|nr:hypothetical protein BCR44DRAFT_32754 [Catenaria anguillulae PL171]
MYRYLCKTTKQVPAPTPVEPSHVHDHHTFPKPKRTGGSPVLAIQFVAEAASRHGQADWQYTDEEVEQLLDRNQAVDKETGLSCVWLAQQAAMPTTQVTESADELGNYVVDMSIDEDVDAQAAQRPHTATSLPGQPDPKRHHQG